MGCEREWRQREKRKETVNRPVVVGWTEKEPMVAAGEDGIEVMEQWSFGNGRRQVTKHHLGSIQLAVHHVQNPRKKEKLNPNQSQSPRPCCWVRERRKKSPSSVRLQYNTSTSTSILVLVATGTGTGIGEGGLRLHNVNYKTKRCSSHSNFQDKTRVAR